MKRINYKKQQQDKKKKIYIDNRSKLTFSLQN